MPLVIPSEHYEMLAKLLRLTPMNRALLLKELKKEPPSLYVSSIAKKLSAKLELPEADLRDIIFVLNNLYTTFRKSQVPKDQFVKDFVKIATDPNKSGIQLNPDEVISLEKDLGEALDLDAVGLTSKALRVMTSHSRIFRDAKVLTDLRPVFQADPELAPNTAVIIHNLRIDFSKSGQKESLYVALDSQDLILLEEVIKRAKLKEVGLINALKPTMRILGPDDAS